MEKRKKESFPISLFIKHLLASYLFLQKGVGLHLLLQFLAFVNMQLYFATCSLVLCVYFMCYILRLQGVYLSYSLFSVIGGFFFNVSFLLVLFFCIYKFLNLLGIHVLAECLHSCVCLHMFKHTIIQSTCFPADTTVNYWFDLYTETSMQIDPNQPPLRKLLFIYYFRLAGVNVFTSFIIQFGTDFNKARAITKRQSLNE